MKKMILAIALLASAGCTTNEKQFTDDEVNKIKKCIEVNELLYLNGHQLIITNGTIIIKMP